MRRLFKGSWIRSPLVMLVAFFVAVLGMAVPAQAADSENDVTIRSVVFVYTSYPAKVVVPWETAEGASTTREFLFTQGQIGGRCSGSIITETGAILTAAHCIQPGDSTRDAARKATVNTIKSEGYTIDDNYDYSGWPVTFGTPTVTVDQPQRSQQTVFVRGELDARIMDAQTSNTGDHALLQLQGVQGMEPLAIAAAKPLVGAKVKGFGFPALTDGATNPKLQDPTFKPLTVTRLGETEGYATPVIEVDGEILGGMSGGPVVDESGAIIGVNSKGFTGMGVSYVTDTDDLIRFLRKNSVDFVSGSAAAPAPGEKSSDQAPAPGPIGAPVPEQAAASGGNMLMLVVVIALGLAVVGMFGFFVALPAYKRRKPAAVPAVPAPAAPDTDTPAVPVAPAETPESDDDAPPSD